VARSGCIYSDTGGRKTSQVKSFAHYIAETTGKATLLLSGDGGGWEPCDPEVRAGMILPYRVETSTLPLIILRRISQGFWPKDPNEADPSRINLVPIDYSKVGGIAVEGWTSIGQIIMRYLPDKGINVGGEDRTKLGGFSQQMYVQGELVTEHFRSSTRGDFLFVQNCLYGLVMNFNSLPVSYVLYTALASKTEDDDRTTVYGPSIAGKKATAQCGAWVGDLIHGQDYSVNRKVKVPSPTGTGEVESDIVETLVRFYYKKHPDPTTGIMFPAKARITPERVSALEQRFPGGYFEPVLKDEKMVSGWFRDYLLAIDELSIQQADALRGWREKMDAKLRPQQAAATTTTTK
jgi:hypothetical protein